MSTNQIFQTIYWDDEKSSAVQFVPLEILPPRETITTCMVFAVQNGTHVVLSKPKRGWGIVGGHREGTESPEKCVRREAMEEAAVELGNLHLIGAWQIKKLFDSNFNRGYPEIGYQLLYIANVTKVHEFTARHESSERIITPIENVKNLHHDIETFNEVLKYIQTHPPSC